ncbi:DsrE family protein [Pontibacter oryzae]|uniref:Uncharacterized protein n=1 Tax=Pontibacter oryzae TaxID=2304593 RepID=A0A399RYC7_9BACT|nr:DsrE family protein [Pontibacter oryzae]RIJ34405.1 hypothetical protein D1627_15930 [Pontibacter oryzae]
MHILTKFAVFFVLILVFALPGYGQQKIAPVIVDFGAINPVPQAVKKPDPSLTYKILVDATKASDKPEEIVPALTNTARMLNLHAYGGVPSNKMQVVLVVHSAALPMVLTNEAYKSKFGVDNPNLAIIAALKKAGVQLFVCGQSMIARNYEISSLNPDITLSVSALTVLTEYQLKGYALISL